MTETNGSNRARTPWHLWVVGIIALLWDAMGAFNYLMTQTRNEAYMASFTPEQLEFYYGFPSWVVGAWAIAVWGGLLGAVLLLLRRKLAFPVLLVSLIAMVLTTIHNYVLSNGMEVMGGAGALIFSAIIFLVALALVIYSWAMTRNGVLV